MRIRNYKSFLESQKLLTYDKDKYLEGISLIHCGEHIYAVVIEDEHARAMAFLRPQEFYESTFENIIRKQFKFSDFQNQYKQHYGKQEFTYGEDWSGFNIPSNILEDCMFNIDESDINNYDKIMLSIIHTIKELEGESKYYLLGVDQMDNDLLEHEFAHAMYFTLPSYKEAMTKVSKNCSDDVKSKMCKCIVDYGYADHVIQDELQAYMSTGLGEQMEDLGIENIEEEIEKYREVFEEFYSANLYENPKTIKINWEI
jgi:hypothetical protein